MWKIHLNYKKIDNSRRKNEIKWSNTLKTNNFPPLLKKKQKQTEKQHHHKASYNAKIKVAELSFAIKKVKLGGKGTAIIKYNNGESLEKLQNVVMNKLSDN